MMTDAAHFMESGAREKVLEHLFVGDLLRCLWCKGQYDVEVLRPEVDRTGYDLVLVCNGVTRHVQLKSSASSAKTNRVSVNVRLLEKPGGCVIWFLFDPSTLELGPFRWFGGAPGHPLPDLGGRVGRHTRGNRLGVKAERPAIRILRQGQFETLAGMGDLAVALFGPRQLRPLIL